MTIDLDISGPPSATRIVVAMSGGVDSSVAAALVKEAGYDAVGVTLQLYDHGAAVHRSGACCAGQDIDDARRVAETIGIPHYVLDYESRFRKAVIEPFAESYVAGETPIPCAACNQTVKFSDLLTMAGQLGAKAMVTGHYIRSRQVGNHRGLFRPVDLDRDQSYFLYGTTQDQLDNLRFPLGDLSKDETRALARDLGLSVADKKDSQDICFVPQGRYTDVIERLNPAATEPGDIVHLDGGILGQHNGIVHYTIGQRRGLGISAAEPLYVIKIDAATRRVVVGPREALAVRRINVRSINWIGDGTAAEAAGSNLPVYARVRSTRPPRPAIMGLEARGESDGASEIFVDLAEGEMGVAPGQACVLYENDQPDARVLGGGTIASSVNLDQANAA